jgi:hypothetical protein
MVVMGAREAGRTSLLQSLIEDLGYEARQRDNWYRLLKAEAN